VNRTEGECDSTDQYAGFVKTTAQQRYSNGCEFTNGAESVWATMKDNPCNG